MWFGNDDGKEATATIRPVASGGAKGTFARVAAAAATLTKPCQHKGCTEIRFGAVTLSR